MRIVRVNPRDGSEATELDLPNILRQHWGIPASYVKLAHAFGPGVALQGLRFDGDYPMASLQGVPLFLTLSSIFPKLD